MTNLQGKHILLGITGGIAAYKAAELTRLLVKQGAEVRICMTEGAMSFITPLTLQALSGNPVHHDLLDTDAEAAMGHIELAKWADSIIIAPATANTLARLAHGLADNLLTTLVLASKARIYIAPAMNQAMWHHPQTQQNIRLLNKRDVVLLGPAQGEQACGDTGFGRMLEPADIVQQFIQDSMPILAGISVLITAGPTREALDPVRYLSNRSSGKMGYAIAQAAQRLGAKVTLISGPVALDPPVGIKTLKVESAREMLAAAELESSQADIFIACAAVADYAPAEISDNKIKKSDDELSLTLIKNPDILATISHDNPQLFTVGFAAETNKLKTYAKAKLRAKKLNMIAANSVGKQQGFEVDENALEVFWKEGRKTAHQSLPMTSKSQLAYQLLHLIEHHYQSFNKKDTV